jgi:hypothetical protein
MGDFKAQLVSDMSVFHNPGEFAHITNIWYLEKQHTVPAIIDHTAAEDRSKTENDHAEGIYRANCLVYIALRDLGFVPKKDRNIEIEEAGAVNTYRIEKADCEDGEIILELELMDE